MSSTISPEQLFAELEADRASGDLRKKVLWKGYGYQSSKTHIGYIEKINRKGEVIAVGKYQNGDFVEICMLKPR